MPNVPTALPGDQHTLFNSFYDVLDNIFPGFPQSVGVRSADTLSEDPTCRVGAFGETLIDRLQGKPKRKRRKSFTKTIENLSTLLLLLSLLSTTTTTTMPFTIGQKGKELEGIRFSF